MRNRFGYFGSKSFINEQAARRSRHGGDFFRPNDKKDEGWRQRIRRQIKRAQQVEITEYEVYRWLANKVHGRRNRELLLQIAADEKNHASFWQKYTKESAKPSNIKLFLYRLISFVLGFTFAVKLMEQGEKAAQIHYQEIAKEIPEAKTIEQEENEHEKKLLKLLDEDRLKYIGSMVLGLSDALVELTGTLAGLTLALQNTRLIAIIGLITGIAAALSMAASEYLSTKAEEQGKDAVRASFYTGVMYIATVVLLIVPFYIFVNALLALGVTLFIAMIIILFFTFYTSVAQDLPFRKRFLEMAIISLGVSALTFAIGYLVRNLLEIEV